MGPSEIRAATEFPSHKAEAAIYPGKLILGEAHLYGHISFEVMGLWVSKGNWGFREMGILTLIFQLRYFICPFSD